MPYVWLASCLIPDSSCCLCSDDGISPAAILSSPFECIARGDEQDNNMTWILRTDHLGPWIWTCSMFKMVHDHLHFCLIDI
jgi:hypothetical protein